MARGDTVSNMAITLNKPTKGVRDWDVPLNENFDELMNKAAEKGEILVGDIKDSEFNVANKLPKLDANIFLLLSQITGNVPSMDANGKLILTGSSQIGTKAADLAALWTKAIKIMMTDIDSGEFDAANKIPKLDASGLLKLAQIVGNILGLDVEGKLDLSQIGTKATDLAALWDKTTKIVTGDIDGDEFNVANKLTKLDASAYLLLAQIIGNVPSLDANGKLILTGSGQIGTKAADLTELWTKGTLIDDSMIGLNEIHAEGSSNFAGPGGVTVTHSLNLANYTPTIIPTTDGAGAIGEWWVTDKAVDSFVVRNSGSGVTAFTWIIHNRT